MREEHKNYNEWWSVASFADILCVGHGLLQYRPASKKLKYRLEAGFLIFLGA